MIEFLQSVATRGWKVNNNITADNTISFCTTINFVIETMWPFLTHRLSMAKVSFRYVSLVVDLLISLCAHLLFSLCVFLCDSFYQRNRNRVLLARVVIDFFRLKNVPRSFQSKRGTTLYRLYSVPRYTIYTFLSVYIYIYISFVWLAWHDVIRKRKKWPHMGQYKRKCCLLSGHKRKVFVFFINI